MDIGYYIVNLYLIAFIFSIVISVMAVIRRNYNSLSWSVVLFFACFIGMGFGWKAWFRVFSSMYGIVWGGGG